MKEKQLVEHTNDWSINSKRSMIDAGYFKDDFIHLFSSKKRRSPLINLCYYVRACVIDKTLRNFMCLNSSRYQVISLGAGYDTTFFRLFSKGKNVKYCEIDLSTVVRRKIEILLSSKETKDLFLNCTTESEMERSDNYYYLNSDHYSIFSQNLNDTAQLDVRLKSFGIDYNLPTVILSEVAITYMEEVNCTALCKFLGEKFINGALVVYEQIEPEDGFGQFMMNHFNTIQSPLKSLTRYNRVKDNPSLFYVNNGWENCNMSRVIDLYEAVMTDEDFMSTLKIEPFDEWEEFHLTCLHYAIYIASNGIMTNTTGDFNVPKISSFAQVRNQLNCSTRRLKQSVERFGHRIAKLDDHSYLLIGGVGIENNCHKKMSLLQRIDLRNEDVSYIETRLTQLALTYMAGCEFEIDCRLYYFLHGGCKSPVREGCSDGYVFKYEPPSSFSLVSILSNEGVAKPCHRWRHTTVSWKSSVFIFGGRTSNLQVLNDFWMIKLSKNSEEWLGDWVELERGPPARFSHSCTSTSDESLVIVGGIGANFRPLGDVWKWNTSTGWNQIDVNMSIPRYGHTSHLICNKLVLVGGVTLDILGPGISVVDLVDKKCQHYLLPIGDHKDPIMLHNHQSILSNDNHILVIGGGGNCFSFGTSFTKDLIYIPIDQFFP